MSSILSLSHSSIDLARAVVANHDPCTKQTTNKSAFGHHVSLGFRVEPSVYGLGTGGAIYSSVVMTLQCGADQIDRVDLCGFHNTNNGRRYEIQCMFPRLVMKYETGSSAMIVRVLSVEFRMELDFERMIRLIEGLNLRYKPFIAQKAPGTALRGSTVSPLTTAPMVHNFTPYRNVHTASPAPMSSTFRSQGLDLGGVGDRAFSPLQQEVSKGQPTSLTSYADMGKTREHQSHSSPLKGEIYQHFVHDTSNIDSYSQSLPSSQEVFLGRHAGVNEHPIINNNLASSFTRLDSRELMPPPRHVGTTRVLPSYQQPPISSTPQSLRFLPSSQFSDSGFDNTGSQVITTGTLTSLHVGGNIDDFLPPPRSLPFNATQAEQSRAKNGELVNDVDDGSSEAESSRSDNTGCPDHIDTSLNKPTFEEIAETRVDSPTVESPKNKATIAPKSSPKTGKRPIEAVAKGADVIKKSPNKKQKTSPKSAARSKTKTTKAAATKAKSTKKKPTNTPKSVTPEKTKSPRKSSRLSKATTSPKTKISPQSNKPKVYANKKDIKKPGTPKSLATESSASTEQTAAIDPSAVTADRIATETSTMQMDEDISKAQDNRSSDLLAKVLTGLFGSPSHMFAAIEKDAPWLLGKS
ncbi:uncharacterized protein BROUX77_000690 [Berkeleyomyces rouxiae]|uniref:uncharacterized protein n=1 Tax=Berkeleyomyces rouxiae TaxID=2035830 RepID=UPI003B78BCE0